VRAQLLIDLSEEKAREIVDRKFTPVRDLMLDYADRYSAIVEDNREAKRRGEAEKKALPPKPSLKAAAEKEGLVLVTTPLLSREAAAREPQIGSAKVGVSRLSEGRPFADEMFGSETLFEPIDLVNTLDQYFLAWKIADNPPRVPPLSEIRAEVVRAWKLEQARPKALLAAQSLAEKVRKAGGKLTPELVGDKMIQTTGPITLLETAALPVPGQFSPPKPRPTEIREIPNAGDTLRQDIFDLEPGQVIVESDQAKANIYVITLLKRFPVSYTTLYAPYGPRMSLQYEVTEDARQRRLDAWLATLRSNAGLKPDWSPPEEAEPRSTRRRG
jgi:peptidyl-prolyl cis-trans isomerase D